MTDAVHLEAILDQVHRSILAANFAALPQLMDETDRLVQSLIPLTDKIDAERIWRKATRNGLCLQAAARGIRAAQRRMDDVNAAGTQLATYTSGGQRAEINTGLGAMTKRL